MEGILSRQKVLDLKRARSAGGFNTPSRTIEQVVRIRVMPRSQSPSRLNLDIISQQNKNKKQLKKKLKLKSIKVKGLGSASNSVSQSTQNLGSVFSHVRQQSNATKSLVKMKTLQSLKNIKIKPKKSRKNKLCEVILKLSKERE